MKSIIFGANGQDGKYLSSYLHALGHDTIKVSRNASDESNLVVGSVTDIALVKKLLNDIRPDFIFHFAANSTTRHDALFENHDTIATGSLNILESVLKYSPSSKVFLSGSGLQFINKGRPISENDEFWPSSPYSVSRIQSVYAARYFRSLGIKVYVGYFFNHDSPLRSERHVNQKVVQAVKRIAFGSKEKLEISDLTIRKEFAFAGDIVEAIYTLVNNEQVFESVIGSGKAYRIEDWVKSCFAYYGLDWKDYVVQGAPLKKEYDVLVSDPSTIFSLGWRPKLDIQDLAKLMIEN